LTGSSEIIQRRPGISRTIFIVTLVVVAAVSGVTGYLVNGFLHPSPAGETLNGAGATFPYPFLSAVGSNYSRIHPNILINYQAIGSGGGIKALGAKTVDFAASDAPLSPAQTTALPAAALHIPETIGVIVVAYNLPGISTGLNLNATTIAKMFQGNITMWNDPNIQQLNPSLTLPAQTIIVAHRSEGSGTTFVFSGYLKTAASNIWVLAQATSISWPVGLGAFGNQGVAGLVLGTKYTVGYVELAYALTNPMSYAFVRNYDGTTFVKPSLTNATYAVQNATALRATLPQGNQSWASVNLLNAKGLDSYPIVSFSYLLVYTELSIVPGMTLDKAKAVVDFLWFTVHSGQAQASPLAYVPLPAGIVAIDERSIESITFNGQTLPT
jgi:phosphate ABC transporter phosphate-binding protein